MSEAGAPKQLDGHRLTEFIYGTVTALVALAGLSGGQDTLWWENVVIIVVGAAAVWVAHAYSGIMSLRVTSGHPLSGHDLLGQLRATWPIVSAGIIVSLPLFLTGLGMIPLATALTAASIVGIAVLALVGALAGVVVKESVPRTIVLALMSAGLGAFVVAVELAIHH